MLKEQGGTLRQSIDVQKKTENKEQTVE